MSSHASLEWGRWRVIACFGIVGWLGLIHQGLRAEYIDENGMKRVGKPGDFSRGYRDETGTYRMGEPPSQQFSGKKSGKSKKEEDTLPEGILAPEIFGADALRVIDNQIVDFTSVAVWANEFYYLLDTAPDEVARAVRSGKSPPDKIRTKPKINGWENRWRRNQQEASGYQKYLLTGKIVKVLPEGLLLEVARGSTRTKVLLKQFPDQEYLADGDRLETLALPAGQYRNDKLVRNATIRVYEYGRLATEKDRQMKILDLRQ